MTSKYQYFEAQATNYAYTITGQGVPIVFLHGFTGTTATWDECGKAFTHTNQVIAIDLPGHGRTTGLAAKTMEQLASDLAAIFTFLQLEKVHLVGYSMGGRVALTFSLLYPDWVRSLTLESASPGLASLEERATRREADEMLAERIMQDGIEQFVAYWENIPLFASQQKLPVSKQQAIRAERLQQSARGLADSLRYIGTGKQPSWWDSLSEVKCPTLLVVGEDDAKFVKLNEKMVILIDEAKLVCVENAGHAIHIEQATQFEDVLRNFLIT